MAGCHGHTLEPWAYRNRREAHITLHVVSATRPVTDMPPHPGPYQVYATNAEAVAAIKAHMSAHPTDILVNRNRRPSKFAGGYYGRAYATDETNKEDELYSISRCGENFEWTFVDTAEKARAFLCKQCNGEHAPLCRGSSARGQR